MQDVTWITELILQGYFGLFIACLVINMIPFLSPSNMVLAGVASLILPSLGWVQIGIIVATAATLAKTVHYVVVRGSRTVVSEERLKALEREEARVKRWGALALFIAAASPVPDDPLIVYVGLTKYSPFKFILIYFAGKVSVTLAGALIGYNVGTYFEAAPVVVASIALTAVITGWLLRHRGSRENTESGGQA